MVIAVDGVEAALKAVVDLVPVVEDAAFWVVRFGEGFLVLEFPELGLAAAQAALLVSVG